MKDFTPVPNEWFDHRADGRLTGPMFDILTYLMRTCTWTTGVWRGEAERIRYGLNREWSVSQINRYLTRLHNCRYITRRNTQGRRGSYPILLNNYALVDADEDKVLRRTILRDWREFDSDDASLAACEMRVRRVGDASDDACEMRSNPDVPNVTPNVPDGPNDQKIEWMNTRPPSPSGNQGGFTAEEIAFETDILQSQGMLPAEKPKARAAAGGAFEHEDAE